MHEKCYETTLPEGLEGLSQYIENDSQKKASLELALQAYKDVAKQRKEREEGIQAAHGNVWNIFFCSIPLLHLYK